MSRKLEKPPTLVIGMNKYADHIKEVITPFVGDIKRLESLDPENEEHKKVVKASLLVVARITVTIGEESRIKSRKIGEHLHLPGLDQVKTLIDQKIPKHRIVTYSNNKTTEIESMYKKYSIDDFDDTELIDMDRHLYFNTTDPEQINDNVIRLAFERAMTPIN